MFKLVVYLCVSMLQQEDSIFNLIGKNISAISHTQLENEYENGGKTYIYHHPFTILGSKYDNLSLYTDSSGVVEDISFFIPGILEKSLYSKMVAAWEEPEGIYKINEKTMIHGPTSTSLNGIQSMKSEGFMKKCTIDDDPLLIIWNKGNFNIRVELGTPMNPFQSVWVKIKKGNVMFNKEKF